MPDSDLPPIILVVDDAAETREMLRCGLETFGFRVEVAANGAAALDAVRHRSFGAVVTDMWMPEMTGAEFVTAARADIETRSIPIIMMSGAFQAGLPANVAADAFLHKPVEFAPLIELLGRFHCFPAH